MCMTKNDAAVVFAIAKMNSNMRVAIVDALRLLAHGDIDDAARVLRASIEVATVVEGGTNDHA